MERWHAKVIAGVVMLIAILICFLLPVKLTGFFLRKGNRGQYYLDLLACFAGGVFLAAYLIFMAPSVRELLIVNLMRPYSIEYPLPDMLIGIGFFVLLLLNRTVILFSKMSKRLLKKERHSNGDSIVEKSFVPTEAESCQPTIDAPQLETENGNGIVLTICRSDTTASILDKDTYVVPVEAEECFEHNCHTKSPYPLPRRSSITDVAHQDSTVRSIVMMLALSLDSVLEGVTTGLKTTVLEVRVLCVC
jgi:zinc transporter ZupT